MAAKAAYLIVKMQKKYNSNNCITIQKKKKKNWNTLYYTLELGWNLTLGWIL